jgi:bacterioferritin-associated ferredoxin
MAAMTSEAGPGTASREVNHRFAHESRCGICSHPERQAIESAFQQRRMSIAEIGRRYGVGHDAVYRHAHAVGLLKRGERRPRFPPSRQQLRSRTPAGSDLEELASARSRCRDGPVRQADSGPSENPGPDDALATVLSAIQKRTRTHEAVVRKGEVYGSTRLVIAINAFDVTAKASRSQ